MIELIQRIQQLSKGHEPFVLVTLVNLKGSAPQIAGAKMLVSAKGLDMGTVGGGKIEARCISHAQELLRDPKGSSQMMTWNLQTEIGMSCGGEVSLFFDLQKPLNWQVAIFGAGHISQEICRILQTWSCQVNVFDPRAEWLEKLPSSHNLQRKLSENMSAEVASLSEGAFVLCMTQGHATDLPILRAIFESKVNFKMIGVIGSDVKARKIKGELKEFSISQAQLDRLHCPLGLDIGNNTPPEIAISVCAQLLAVRDEKPSDANLQPTAL